ncbi:MAG TPA: hypothetical protein VFE19_12875 [Jatrophihabitantaceae bacterium]|nr:hypothetical protein [Jatrophihabitantaceae bacterium]
MSIRKRAAIGVATAGVAVLAVSALAAPGSAGAAKAAKIPVVVAHINSKHINLSTGSVRAGTIEFKVVTHKGDHLLQVAKLHKGYSLPQAGADLQKALSGNVPAIKRIDHRITFRGGAEARPKRPGAMSVRLTAGDYVLIDQNGSAVNFLKVRGNAPAHQAAMPYQGRLTTFTYGFDPGSAGVPAKGWTRIYNHSDQPHFVEMQQVQPNTTRKQVHQFINSGAQGNPPWALKGEAGSGVISPRTSQLLRWNIPAGKYLVACFWPDMMTGMPHFFMGMWRFVTVK